jgi:hypothetical protein
VVARKSMMTFDLVEHMASDGLKLKKGLVCSQYLGWPMVI